MPPTLTELQTWMATAEDEHLEFKEAKASYSQDKAIKYCCALANEGGGRLVLGVTDRRPRHIRESKEGAKFEDLQQVLPGQPEWSVKALLKALKAEGLIVAQGKTRGARWFPVKNVQSTLKDG